MHTVVVVAVVVAEHIAVVVVVVVVQMPLLGVPFRRNVAVVGLAF